MNSGFEQEKPLAPSSDLIEMLDRTRGEWTDWDGIERLLDDAREKWDIEWQDRLVELAMLTTGKPLRN